jgi:radical SAM protein with 4Fe4S-binding SPASM domain
MVLGNVKQEPLGTIWDRLNQLRMDHAIPKRAHCGDCSRLKFCGGGCPGEDPTPGADFLTTCDRSNYELIPLVAHRYEAVMEKRALLSLV